MAAINRTRVAAEYLEWCSESQNDTIAAAASLERYLSRVIADANIRTLLVSARAKSMESVRGKLLRKRYARPRAQLTDRLAARVIVYHSSEVDRVANYLRTTLNVREHQSSDKRLALGLREFGYRSYHLVASASFTTTTVHGLESLSGIVFEVQIRSLLEHIWAEIEHDVVYKSGASLPLHLKRRFASLAGVLELLEHEFHQLTGETLALTDRARRAIAADPTYAAELDVPHLLAFLEVHRPDGLSFRTAASEGRPFPPGIEQRMLLSLQRSGVTSLVALGRALHLPTARRAIRRYARAEGIRPADVSHLAVLALLVGSRSRPFLRVFFPEFATEASLACALR